MRKKRHLVSLFLCAVICTAILCTPFTALGQGKSLLANGDFSQGAKGWGLYKESGGSADFAAGDGKGILTVKKTGSKDYSVQLYYDGFGLEQGGKYRLAFSVTSTVNRTIRARIQLNGGDYFGYCEQNFDLEADIPTDIELFFEMTKESDPAPRLCFNCGKLPDSQDLDSHTLTFEKVEVILLDGSNIKQAKAKEAAAGILVNQIGYLPASPKTALFREGALLDTFEVVDASGKVVFSGKQSTPINDPASGDTVAMGDFSEVSAPGVYTVRAGKEASPVFTVGENTYQASFSDVVRFFYLQRCGMELTKELAGVFAHPACHASIATVYGTGEKKDVLGGWHDAGDYGRYVSPAAKTAADLLLAYEANPSLFSDDTRIPESGNGIPDVLDEARFELDWLLKMQDEKTGGAYHKVTCMTFPGMVMPEEETAPLVICPVSTTATGDYAAIMALAARMYETTDAAFATTCLDAAKKAWAYLQANPDGGKGFLNPQGIVTGEYGDGNDTDERYWAACELYHTTGLEEYRTAAESLLEKNPPQGLGWTDMGTYGHMAYLAAGLQNLGSAYETVKNIVLSQADQLMALSKKDGYRSTLGMDYPWGSNMSVANNALHLLLAASLDSGKAEEYTETAWQHLHYLMGANPTGYCYISGYGTKSPVSLHHRPSEAMKQAMPGMLSGGPDAGMHDPYAKAVLTGLPPAKCYVDNVQSYSTNEVAIYWNSSLAYLIALLLK